jgi:hypothetical protein
VRNKILCGRYTNYKILKAKLPPNTKFYFKLESKSQLVFSCDGNLASTKPDDSSAITKIFRTSSEDIYTLPQITQTISKSFAQIVNGNMDSINWSILKNICALKLYLDCLRYCIVRTIAPIMTTNKMRLKIKNQTNAYFNR